MAIRKRTSEDMPSVLSLLSDVSLPAKGLENTRGWVVELDGRVVGHVALEESAPIAVLRSLVVAPASRGRGLARELVEVAEKEAGGKVLTLRTKTVGEWMERRGYRKVSVEELPPEVRTTSEFEGTICSSYPIYAKL